LISSHQTEFYKEFVFMTKNYLELPGIEEIGYKFKNENYLIEALTHPSYSSENSLNYNNQRLEFLGDSVLQLIVTTYLYEKYPDTDEGELTKMRSFLTQKSTLAIFAEHVKLSNFIRMGKGEIKSDGHKRKSTLCDAFEAVTGAIYIDGGMRAARDFIIPLIEHFYPELVDIISGFNPKGYLQEIIQAKMHSSPSYKLEMSEGPPHRKSFTISVWVAGQKLAVATANSRKAAEAKAAEKAIKALKSEGGLISQSEGENIKNSLPESSPES